MNLLSIDERIIWDVIQSNFKNFEDALQSYAAIDSGKVKTILTRKVKEYKHNPLVMTTPKNYQADNSNLEFPIDMSKLCADRPDFKCSLNL